MENLKYWVWLSRIELEAPGALSTLLKKYKTPEKIWELDCVELLKNNLKKEQIEEILKVDYRKNLNKYLDYMHKHNIETITINDENYPKQLKNIYDPPIALYIKGNKKILNNLSLAIVGCRECSLYGMKIARAFAKSISKCNINIVSGLAKGIDSSSHIGTLEGKGKTIAVVGTGLDIVYPKENKYLQDRIINENGAVVSEFVIGTKINKINFPKRNRIISGLSNGVLVVEAKEKSGAFITVDYALEQGKNVYVIPGNIDSKNSEGTNNLAKQGAKIVTELKDILEDYVEKNFLI